MAYRDLCKPCSLELAKTKTVIYHAGGVNNKITCYACGLRRYGATYMVRSIGRQKGKAVR